MDMEHRQREAGLPPLSGPESLPHDLGERGPAESEERVATRAREGARRSRERRAKKATSAGRARATLAAGSLLAMLGLGGAMWLGADNGTADSEPPPGTARGGVPAPASPGVEVPAAPEASPVPADRAPQVSSGAS